MDGGRRRIDRVTNPGYLDDLGSHPIGELRDMRDDCRLEESRLSYTRRLLHAELDILRAERQRRERGEDLAAFLRRLPEILADAPHGGGRHTAAAPMFDPTTLDNRRADDRPLEAGALNRMVDLGDAELDALEDELVERERRISEQRSTVFRHHDALQAELVRRYREEGVATDAIVSEIADDERLPGRRPEDPDVPRGDAPGEDGR
jgi:hypothetical protein